MNLYSSRIDREVLIDVALAIIEANEETKKELFVTGEDAPF